MKKNKGGKEWFGEKEASTSTRPYRLTFWCLKHLPRWLVNFITYCAALYFFIFDKRCRRESLRYQRVLRGYSSTFKKVKPLRQVAAFAVTLVEKIDCWTNPVPFENIHFNDDDVSLLIEQLNKGQGAFLIVSHLGDFEILRSLANKSQIGVKRDSIPMVVFSDMDVSSNFTQAMNKMSAGYTLNMINVNDITPATMETILDTIKSGGLVVCSGDRLSKNKSERVLTHDFLGKRAPFSYGAYVLADLVAAPVYFVWGFRKGNLVSKRECEMYVVKAKSQVGGGRKDRDKRADDLCAEYVRHLEFFAQKYPYQWYNFFDFWMFPNQDGEKNGN
ncbi:MAG: hypothetical protein IKN82_11135 [Treponema sp.]|nr:hypothetical protein [Treponema sp.]